MTTSHIYIFLFSPQTYVYVYLLPTKRYTQQKLELCKVFTTYCVHNSYQACYVIRQMRVLSVGVRPTITPSNLKRMIN